MDPADFGLELILAEEHGPRQRKPVRESNGPEVRETLVIQRQDFTTASAFTIHEPGTSMPVDGPGMLTDILIIADSDQFDIHVEIDGRDVVADSFTDLQDDTVELSRIAAYQRSDDNFVIDISEYDFRDRVDASITPQESITFLRQRAEFDLL